jgi:hypothetical protein
MHDGPAACNVNPWPPHVDHRHPSNNAAWARLCTCPCVVRNGVYVHTHTHTHAHARGAHAHLGTQKGVGCVTITFSLNQHICSDTGPELLIRVGRRHGGCVQSGHTNCSASTSESEKMCQTVTQSQYYWLETLAETDQKEGYQLGGTRASPLPMTRLRPSVIR